MTKYINGLHLAFSEMVRLEFYEEIYNEDGSSNEYRKAYLCTTFEQLENMTAVFNQAIANHKEHLEKQKQANKSNPNLS